jgi:hypothetical protein
MNDETSVGRRRQNDIFVNILDFIWRGVRMFW